MVQVAVDYPVSLIISQNALVQRQAEGCALDVPNEMLSGAGAVIIRDPVASTHRCAKIISRSWYRFSFARTAAFQCHRNTRRCVGIDVRTMGASRHGGGRSHHAQDLCCLVLLQTCGLARAGAPSGTPNPNPLFRSMLLLCSFNG